MTLTYETFLPIIVWRGRYRQAGGFSCPPSGWRSRGWQGLRLERKRECWNLDASLLLAIQDLRLDWLDPVVAFYTQLGNAGLMWIVLSLSMLCWRPTRRAGALALTAMVLGLLVTNVTIKPLMERTRPWLDLPILPLVVENDPHSFPSGHTCAAFAAGVAWAKTLPWRWGRIGAVGPDGAVPAVCGSPLSHGCAGWGFDRNTVRLGGAEAGRLQDGSVERK